MLGVDVTLKIISRLSSEQSLSEGVDEFSEELSLEYAHPDNPINKKANAKRFFITSLPRLLLATL